MKTLRLALVFVVLVSVSCGGRTYQGQLPCPVLTVENRNFADVVIRVEGYRVGMAPGLRRTEFRACMLRDRPSTFDIHAFGGAFDFRLSGIGSRILPEDEITIVIGPVPNLSYVIGAALESTDGIDRWNRPTESTDGIDRWNQEDTTVLAVNAHRVIPLGMYLGIWYDVTGCLGMYNDEVPDPLRDVVWMWADSLKGSEGILAYGISQFEPMEIVLEWEYRFHPTVISHEVVHLLTVDRREDTPEMRGCVMVVPGGLPLRRWR